MKAHRDHCAACGHELSTGTTTVTIPAVALVLFGLLIIGLVIGVGEATVRVLGMP